MLERTQARLLPITSRTADYAPIAPACCNACRVCTATNVVGLAVAGAGALAAVVARAVKRPTRAF